MATIFMTMFENAQDCTLSVRHTNFNISRDWTGFTVTLLLLICQQITVKCHCDIYIDTHTEYHVQ